MLATHTPRSNLPNSSGMPEALRRVWDGSWRLQANSLLPPTMGGWNLPGSSNPSVGKPTIKWATSTQGRSCRRDRTQNATQTDCQGELRKVTPLLATPRSNGSGGGHPLSKALGAIRIEADKNQMLSHVGVRHAPRSALPACLPICPACQWKGLSANPPAS